MSDKLIALLAADLRVTARLHWELCEELADRCHVQVRMTSTWRSPKEQLENYSKGRVKVGNTWVKNGKIVTNALPGQTPHCVTKKDGTPWAMAWDILLLDTGRILPDTDARWHIVPAAAGIIGDHDELTVGADFHSIRDLPHVERKDWQKLCRDGILLET